MKRVENAGAIRVAAARRIDDLGRRHRPDLARLRIHSHLASSPTLAKGRSLCAAGDHEGPDPARDRVLVEPLPNERVPMTIARP